MWKLRSLFVNMICVLPQKKMWFQPHANPLPSSQSSEKVTWISIFIFCPSCLHVSYTFEHWYQSFSELIAELSNYVKTSPTTKPLGVDTEQWHALKVQPLCLQPSHPTSLYAPTMPLVSMAVVSTTSLAIPLNEKAVWRSWSRGQPRVRPQLEVAWCLS